MDLKKTFSFQWRMFASLALTLWVAIACMVVWEYHSEQRLRTEKVIDDLQNITVRIVNAYERNYNPLPFIDFVSNNYTSGTIYKDLRISVYLDGRLYYNSGQTIPYDPDEWDDGADEVEQLDVDGTFYRSLSHSGDKRLAVLVDAPNNSLIEAATEPPLQSFVVFIVIGALLTFVSYISTRLLGRNLANLRLFTRAAVTGSGDVPNIDFPHDELGDISRQIVQMYQERRHAIDKMRREHNVAMHAMEEKGRMKRQLTSNINHELKTPIGVIKGYLDTILQNPDMDAATREHFTRKALEHANRLVSLINDISTMSRLEEGANIIATEDLDFHDLAFSVASEIQESGEVQPLDFVFDVPVDCYVKGNYSLLSAMLHNLAKNAAAYSKGTECGITYSHEDERYRYFVFYDNGRGVGAEHLPHLFERFYRIDSGRARKSGGTGLGLAIVENTVRAHRGEIIVYNREEGGLAFRFSLPKP